MSGKGKLEGSFPGNLGVWREILAIERKFLYIKIWENVLENITPFSRNEQIFQP